MKKIILTVLFVTCLALVMASPSLATTGTSFTGSTYMSYGTYASVIVTTSNNVYVLYLGDTTNAQSYGAYSKNQAGDKYYATGGGQGASNGIYYEEDATYVGYVTFPNCDSTQFVTGSGWTAQ